MTTLKFWKINEKQAIRILKTFSVTLDLQKLSVRGTYISSVNKSHNSYWKFDYKYQRQHDKELQHKCNGKSVKTKNSIVSSSLNGTLKVFRNVGLFLRLARHQFYSCKIRFSHCISSNVCFLTYVLSFLNTSKFCVWRPPTVGKHQKVGNLVFPRDTFQALSRGSFLFRAEKALHTRYWSHQNFNFNFFFYFEL